MNFKQSPALTSFSLLLSDFLSDFGENFFAFFRIGSFAPNWKKVDNLSLAGPEVESQVQGATPYQGLVSEVLNSLFPSYFYHLLSL